MKNQYVFGGFLLLFGAAASHADDLACKKLLLDAMTKAVQSPNHRYMTRPDPIHAGKIINEEVIYADQKIYSKLDGVWTLMPTTPRQMVALATGILTDSKNTSCSHVRDEMIDGGMAAVYDVHMDSDYTKLQALMWISKSQGWLVREDAHAEAEHFTVHMTFTGISAPPNAKVYKRE